MTSINTTTTSASSAPIGGPSAQPRSGGQQDASLAQRPAGQEAAFGPPSVSVQSQLATSTIDAGKPQAASNLGQVVDDLTSVRSAHSGWLDSETQKLDQWGQSEVSRLLEQAKEVEKRLILDAQQRQKVIEEEHKAELARMVQQMDGKKAQRLKDLEDSMQREIQAALTSSKRDIANVETQLNERKMKLLAQSQKQASKDVDRLSNLAVTAKLQPSVTRTTIETNTETGTVAAVAAGGQIRTGGAQAQSIGGAELQAAPRDGSLRQEAQVTTGDIRRDDNNATVGQGAIVNTQTQVKDKPIAAGAGSAGAASLERGSNIGMGSNVDSRSASNLDSRGSNLPPDSSLGGGHVNEANRNIASGNVGQAGIPGAGVGAAPTSATGAGVGSGASHKKIDAAYGVPLDKTLGGQTAHHDKDKDARRTDRADDVRLGDKHESRPKEGIFSKMKHALTGEPKSSDAHRGV